MNERVRVLSVKPNDERFTRTFGAYVTVAGGEIGTMLLPKSARALGPDVTVRTWQEVRASDPLIVQLMYDTRMQATWVSAFGSTEGKRAALVKVLDCLLPIVPVADLKRKARGYKDPSALLRLALALEDPRDAEAKTLLVGGLASKKAAVRIAAASAMGVLEWPSFVEAISEALAEENDESARRVLAAALDACNASSPAPE